MRSIATRTPSGYSTRSVYRFMGSSIAMIDRHYGHLARDSREHAVSLLDALAIERAGGRWVDVAGKARNARYKEDLTASEKAPPAAGGRSVDGEAR